MESVYEYIYFVKKLGSFTKAANHLHISQPALSMSIKKLEQEINHEIFDRNAKPIALTEAGQIIFSYIEEVLLLESVTKAALKDLGNYYSGSFTIGASQYFTVFILPDLVSDFINTYPKTNINIIETSSAKLPRLLNDEKIDLIFSLQEFNSDKFSIYKGLIDYLFIAIPKSFITSSTLRQYCLTREDIISKNYDDLKSIPSLNELSKTPFGILRIGNNLYDRARTLFQFENIAPPIIMYLDQLTSAHLICNKGIVATLTTDILIKQIDDNGNLLYLKYNHPLMIRNFNIVLKKKRYMPNIMSRFIKTF